MKRVALFAILTLAILAGPATSQVHLVSFESITNVQDDTLLIAGNSHAISLRVTNTDTSLYNTANGFRVFSDDGATWTTISGAWLNSFDNLFVKDYINLFGVNGAGSDTIGFAGVSFGPPEGLPPGYDDLAYEITIGPTFKADHMKKICLDSSYYPPGGVWKWAPLDATPQVYPDWSGQKCWTVFDPDAPTTILMVEPQLLEFEAEEGGPNPASLTYDVWGSDATGDAFTSTETSPWISLTGGNGTTPGTVTVNVDITGLAPDTYTDSIMVSADLLQSPKYVVVTLDVTPRPRNLVANPATINFSVVEGDPNPSVTTWITEEGGDNIPYSADVITASQWVELTNVSSTTPDSLYVLANLAGLSPGDYSATIQVSSGSADNSPIEIAVNLHIDPAPKYLAVSPPSLAFSAVLGAGNPPGQQLEVSETGGYGITFAASAQNGAWMTVVPQSTTTTALVDVSVDATGLGVGVYADTVVITSDDAENSPLTAQVTLEVLPAPEFVITLPSGLDSMHFSGVEDEPDPPSQAFGVALSDGGAVTFGASTLAPWITLTDETGTTPSEVTVDVQMAGLAVGTHHDSILVGEIFTLDGGSVYSESADDVWVQVYLVIDPAPRYLVVDPDSADFVISEGATSTTPASFIVTEAGGDTIGISFGDPPSWVQLHVADTSYSTPDTITYDVDVSGLAPGHYFDSIAISSSSPLVVNDPIYHLMTLEVLACPELVIDPATAGPHVFSVFEGATVFLEAPVGLLSTGPGELDWYADLAQSASYFTVDISQGTTPSEVGMTYNRTFELAGHYYDSLLFRSDPVEGSTCSSMALMLVDVTVRRPPSDDTVVVGTPAVRPGESIAVPIDFANSCDLFGASGSASWESEYLYLDSISYEESALSDFVHSDYINNDDNVCTFSSAIGGCCPVPPKEDGAPLHNWLNLHFSVHCDAPDGFYELTVPMADSVLAFQIDCGQGIEEEIPEVDAGYIAVEYGENDFCAWVFDLADSSAIGGATVEMWTPFPVIGPGASATTNGHGSFAMTVVPGPFDLWIYADGYYPLEVENPVRGQKMYLTRLPEFTFTPSSQYVFYYCGTNTLFDEPMPVGSVVEVKVGDLLVGRQDSVTTPGVYQFLPVYRASSQFSDDGANYQDILTFYVNGQQAVATGNVEYPQEDFLEIEVCLTAGAVDEEECILNYGWNLVSWDIDTDNDIVELFSDHWQDIDAIVGFEKGGLAYDPDLPQFSTLWQVDHLSGYWINVNNVDGITLSFSGLAVPDNAQIPLDAGWNLVSYLPDVSLEPAVALAGIEDDDNLLWAYGAPGGHIQVYQPGVSDQLESMDPCYGYWLKVSHSDDLHYATADSSPPAVVPSYTRPSRSLAVSNTPVGVEATTNWVNVYSGDLRLDGRAVPAGTEITAHAVADDSKVGGCTVREDGVFGFMSVYAGDGSALRPGESFYLSVDGAETIETFEWTGFGDRIEVLSLSARNGSDNTLPTEYSLQQNYPNPFNPATNIRFTLTSAGEARVEIFNILGKLIAVPFDGQAVAGENSVVWDGRSTNGEAVATGVYLYRLTAGEFTDTKKMMLLK